jgi:hypothetical protein
VVQKQGPKWQELVFQCATWQGLRLALVGLDTEEARWSTSRSTLACRGTFFLLYFLSSHFVDPILWISTHISFVPITHATLNPSTPNPAPLSFLSFLSVRCLFSGRYIFLWLIGCMRFAVSVQSQSHGADIHLLSWFFLIYIYIFISLNWHAAVRQFCFLVSHFVGLKLIGEFVC